MEFKSTAGQKIALYVLVSCVVSSCSYTVIHITSIAWMFELLISLPSPRQDDIRDPSNSDCLEDKREYYQNCSVLDCLTQCSQSAAHLYEQFLQVQQIGFVTLGPLRCA